MTRKSNTGRPVGRPATSEFDTSEQARQRSRAKSKKSQDIGPIPPVTNWERRLACRFNLELFLKTYLEPLFDLEFCRDQRMVVGKAQVAVLSGGLFAVAMPRGSGKTTKAIGTAIWSVLYGHKSFPFLIGKSGPAAIELLENIKFILESTEIFPLLLEDFPEVVFPIMALEGENKRARGQHSSGVKTHIEWSKQHITFPHVPHGNWIDGQTVGPALGAGTTIRVAGITGRIRGFNIKGRRPDFVIPDDVQDDESAYSTAGRVKIERILGSAVIGLAGPGKKISGIMPCTVIAHGDAMDSILDHDKHPEWDSARTKMLYSFPKRMDLWEQYRDIRFAYDPAKEGDKARAAAEATKLYADHRGAMQEGAEIAWPARYAPDELDAIQDAMNLFFQDKFAFWSEYQNEPLAPDDGVETRILDADQIAAKLNTFVRGLIPASATRLTVGIDVQLNALYYVVAAWEENFTGYVVEYGVWPDQGARTYFRDAEIQRSIAAVTGIPGEEAQIFGALDRLTSELMTRQWPRDLVGVSQIERYVIDANWGKMTDVVYKFCQRNRNLFTPSHGKYVGAKSSPMQFWGKVDGERRGLNWFFRPARDRSGAPYLLFDSNFWKSLLHARLMVAMGNVGCLSLFGSDKDAHRMFADHLTAEKPIAVKANDRKVDEWQAKPNEDNHWLDAAVLACVGASMQGVSLPDVHQSTAQPVVHKVSWAERYATANARRA